MLRKKTDSGDLEIPVSIYSIEHVKCLRIIEEDAENNSKSLERFCPDLFNSFLPCF